MKTTCPHCATHLELDPETIAALRGATEFACPACQGAVPVTPLVEDDPGLTVVTCHHCAVEFDVDAATIAFLRDQPHFNCPVCSGILPVAMLPGAGGVAPTVIAAPAASAPIAPRAQRMPVAPRRTPHLASKVQASTAKRGGAASLPGIHRGMNRNLLVLGSISLLVLGGLAFFIASRMAGNVHQRTDTITNEIIHNKFFTDLIASGATTAKDLDAIAQIRPGGPGFIGVSQEKQSWEQARDLAKKTGGAVLTLESAPGLVKQQLTELLASACPELLGATFWLMAKGEARVIDSPDVNVVTTLARPRRVLLQWDELSPADRTAQEALLTNSIGMKFAVIPAGTFQMGDSFGEGRGDEKPVHAVRVSAFQIAVHETTKAAWDAVRNWGTAHGYTDLAAGGGKAPDHPVHTVSWYDMVKWCNACSEQDGRKPCYTVAGTIYRSGKSDQVICDWSANGYRLPTEAEWEKAARGGLEGKRFPWGDKISHQEANFINGGKEAYQTGATGPHPAYAGSGAPNTSPVGSFAPNGYGLYDMAGNVWEWCWDSYRAYAAGSQTDPRGATSGALRVVRGSGWGGGANFCRAAARYVYGPASSYFNGMGFRTARSSVP